MNRILHHLFCITSLAVTSVAIADVIPYLAPRSQGINGARELVGWQSQINKWDSCCNYGSFSVTPEYTRTFKHNRITEALFCDALVTGSNSRSTNCHNDNNNCGHKILIQGTKVAGRTPKALMAENFYLPTDYSSEITFNPRVQNFLVDFNYYQGLDELAEGLYFRIHSPVTWTRWDLNYCEKIINAGTNPMDPGYFNAIVNYSNTATYGIARSQLLENFGQYVSDSKAIEDVNYTIYNPLKSARWNRCGMSKTALAELTGALGWNFVRCKNFLFGLNIRAAAPTGNRPSGKYIFEPIVGNGHHWELGGGMNMWWTWWQSCDEKRNFTAYLDAYATHMFKTVQHRTFDLVGKPLSRYMLAEQFTNYNRFFLATPIGRNLIPATATFNNMLTPLANLTTIPVNVSYAAQGEIIFKLAYTHCNFQFDLGYDFWGRTCAKICKRFDCTNPFKDNLWGLKGDAFVYGFLPDGLEGVDQGLPLSATESQATIFGGTNNYPDGSNSQSWNQNPGIDNALPAVVEGDLYTFNSDTSEWQEVNTSLQPVLLTIDDLDINAAKTKAYSNKLFGHLGYTWKEHEYCTPYLGVGGEVEFGAHSNCKAKTCRTQCRLNCIADNSNCNKFALSQWGVWLKGGVSFN